MIKTQILPLALSCITLFYSTSNFATSSPPGINLVNKNITLEQVTKDVSYLANDKLNGRGNFSAEIHIAANYIAKRFNEAGLVPAKGYDSFFQKYQVKQINPLSLSLSINKEKLRPENLAMASTTDTFNWSFSKSKKQDSLVKIHTIGSKDDMHKTLGKLNALGGQHIVLLHPTHEKMFKRYQQYFAQGLTTLVSSAQASAQNDAMLLVLTSTTTEQVNSFSVKAKNKINISELNNVVATIPGHSKPEEIILYSAHYDHLGIADTQNNTDLIYNGADDDASGTAAIINLAHHFAKQQNNARTLMFAAFSAEEIGGFGSRYFSKQLNPETITAMINIEMIGKPSKFGAGAVWMTGMERSNLGEQLNAALAGTDMKIHQDPYPEQGLFYRSDNATLARLGVPAHSFSSTQLDKDQHYHSVSDDLASLDLASLHKVIKALAVSTQPLVDGKITPSRIDINLIKEQGKIY